MRNNIIKTQSICKNTTELSMKKQLFALLAAAVMTWPSFAAEDTRTVHFIQDDAQVKTVTKAYNLKHVNAADIATFIDAAAHRYWMNSTVRSLDFPAAKQQTIIVTTGEKCIPYIDQIISVLDRPSKKDAFGSAVSGVGNTWKVYSPAHRPVEDLTCYADVMLSDAGRVFADNGVLWLKDDLEDVDYALDWIKYFDRPVPQANITFRYYAVRESTLRDIGLDYLAWKNGPGMNLFDFAFSSGRIAWDRIFNTAANVAGNSAFGWAYGGIFTAPAFDMSFVRLLQQSGEAKVLADASVTLVNNQELATLALTPTYNGIVKDPENHAASVVPMEVTDMMVNIYRPTICFFPDPKEVSEMGWIPSTKEFYAKNRGSLIFSYDLTSSDAVEANNYGTQIGTSTYTDCSLKTIEFGREQILASCTREYDVEQTVGVPFLCQLPILKYIFGTTTTMKEKCYIFVTVEAKLVHPESVAKK